MSNCIVSILITPGSDLQITPYRLAEFKQEWDANLPEGMCCTSGMLDGAQVVDIPWTGAGSSYNHEALEELLTSMDGQGSIIISYESGDQEGWIVDSQGVREGDLVYTVKERS